MFLRVFAFPNDSSKGLAEKEHTCSFYNKKFVGGSTAQSIALFLEQSVENFTFGEHVDKQTDADYVKFSNIFGTHLTKDQNITFDNPLFNVPRFT